MDSTTIILGILLMGIVTVVGGVLLLRLHAFLALVLGALLVGTLTPASYIEKAAVKKVSFSIASSEGTTDPENSIRFQYSGAEAAKPGQQFWILRTDTESGFLSEIASAQFLYATQTDDQWFAVARLVSGEQAAETQSAVTLSKTDIIIDNQAAWKNATKLANKTVGERVSDAFGTTCGKIGILIAMASIIGKCLLDSGSADRIVRSSMKVMGEKRAPTAFMGSAFLLGIPVFFDTVFYLMIPLAKALRMRTGKNYLFYVLAIVAGGSMAHSLVPPTPGPLFVAEQLGVDIGLMMLVGCVIGVFTAGSGYLYARFINNIWELPLRESAEFSLADLEELSQKDESELPGLWISLIPIILPVALIGGYTVIKSLDLNLPESVMNLAATLGNKNIALVISAAIAMGTLVKQKKTHIKELGESIQAALANGGVIILITAAGGAFGGVLQQTGVAGLINDLPQTSPLLIVLLAWLITMAIRTAQGSATVAMITSVGILSGLASSGQLGFHPVYLAIAIGCGSKPIAWMNDSGFWVISKMSGMTEREALKFITPMSIIMGLVGLVTTMIAVTVFPMN